MRLFRSTRVIHGWLGFLVMPWIVIYGLSGLYFHHSDVVLTMLPSSEYDESTLSENRLSQPLSAEDAYSIAVGIWPDSPIDEANNTSYHGFRVYEFVKPEGRVIVAADTGHYYTKSRFLRTTYAPDGKVLHKKIYWGSAFATFHELGWLSPRFGTLFADFTALALITFGLSGMFMWLFPRYKRLRKRLVGSQRATSVG